MEEDMGAGVGRWEGGKVGERGGQDKQRETHNYVS